MARYDDDAPVSRTLLVGLAALVAVALLVGGVVGVVAFGAAKLTGIGGGGGGPSQEPSLYIPTEEPSTSPEAYPDPPDASEPSPTEEPSVPEPTPTEQPRDISLQVFPTEVSGGERINLTGVYPAGEGATLQVQRFEDGWIDFPVTVNVSGGTFTTYLMTGRLGATRFRVIDPATGQASNPVRITIR
jgi:hypothetical protein